MKKIDFGQTLQLLGNVGVVVGILLLAYELNQNRDLMRAQTRNDLAQNVIGLFVSDMDDGELADVIRRGLAGEELSGTESWRYERRMNAWFRHWENMHYQYRAGLYDETEASKNLEAIAVALERDPGWLEYWCRRGALYSSEFAAEFESLLGARQC